MQTADLKVTGMTCGGCIGKVTHALKGVAGVTDARVSLSAGEAKVQFDEALTSPSQLKLAVQKAGFGIGAGKTSATAKPRAAVAGDAADLSKPSQGLTTSGFDDQAIGQSANAASLVCAGPSPTSGEAKCNSA